MSIILLLGAVLGGVQSAQEPAIGLRSIEIVDASRPDPIAAQEQRRWRVDLYYPARRKPGDRIEPYASDARLIADMAEHGYYDVPAEKLRGWTQAPGIAIRDAEPDDPKRARPLVTIAPGSGIAAFNYSRLAGALVSRGYVVAVVDLPYAGVSRLAGGRLLRAADFPGVSDEDPRQWLPAIRAWSTDVSRTIDRLISETSPVRVDPRRIVVTGHSVGGTVALQVCHDEPRVVGCGDFEGAPQASDTFDGGSKRPIFVTASRSAKPDRPFTAPDLSNPFWSYLVNSGPSSWAIAITKASHMSYSDAPYEMPDTLTRFGGELMSPDRTFSLLTGLVDAFARAYAPGGGGDAAFGQFTDGAPEVLARRAGNQPASTK